jgi:hypothetical protein
VGDHLALALGIEGHFADREPFAELEMRQAMTSFLVNGPPKRERSKSARVQNTTGNTTRNTTCSSGLSLV